MFCPACGVENPDGARYCRGCGRPLSGDVGGSVDVPATGGRRGWWWGVGVLAVVVGVAAWWFVSGSGGPAGGVSGLGSVEVGSGVGADPSSWERIPHDQVVFGGSDEQVMSAVAAFGGGLVAVGVDGSGDDDDGAVWVSTDGRRWEQVADDGAVFGGSGEQWMSGVAAFGGGLVAVGYEDSGDDRDGVVWVSTDGRRWERVTDDGAVFGGSGDQRMSAVAAFGGGLVAVGSDGSVVDVDGVVWVSTDGRRWERIPHDGAVFGGRGGQEMFGVAAFGGGLVAVGRDGSGGDWDGAVWVSPAGGS